MPRRETWGARASAPRIAACLAVMLLGLAQASAARAWGDAGHEIVGAIAAQLLEPAVRQRVLEILATDASHLTADTGIAAEATWADHYRDSDRHSSRERYRATRSWHFVDLELDAPDLEAACYARPPLPAGTPASAGPPDACIVDKIDQFRRELAAPDTAPGERRIALQFLLHLLGDLHQPLHAADDRDQGGNAKRVEADGHPGNLHYYWDADFVARLGEDAPGEARALLLGLSSAERVRLAAGTPESWAFETHAIAREHTYGLLPAPQADGRYPLSNAYVADAVEVVRRQLLRGGVRLAAILNEALR